MAAKTPKGAVRKSKPIVSKTSLNSPYEKIWTPVVGDDMQFILQTLLKKFEELGLKKIENQTKSSKGKKGKKLKPSRRKKEKVDDTKTPEEAAAHETPEEEEEEAAQKTPEEAAQKTPEEAAQKTPEEAAAHETPEEEEEEAAQKTPEEAAQKTPEEAAQKTGWTCADLRKQLAIGINEVTRALEKNDLDMVIVCKSAKPEMITRHIIELSYSREAPACQLPRLSENVAPALGLKSVLALGFRKSSDVFREQVVAIKARVPPLHVPWLPAACGQKQDFGVSVEGDKSEEEESVKTTPSRKRKLSPSERLPEVKLQELKVKKIVPNPKKKRKVKVKKSMVKK